MAILCARATRGFLFETCTFDVSVTLYQPRFSTPSLPHNYPSPAQLHCSIRQNPLAVGI